MSQVFFFFFFFFHTLTGPKSFELDRSKSRRIYKPTLRQFGIIIPSYPPPDTPQCVATVAHAMMVKQVFLRVFKDNVSALPDCELWWSKKPLYVNWDEVAFDVETDRVIELMGQVDDGEEMNNR
jgi:hypothetical protein